jgi:hypothetical protein
VAALVVALTPRSLVRFVAVVGVSAIALALFTHAGPLEVWHSDWPLLVLGGVSVTILLRDERGTTVATLALGGVLLLGSVYVLKNPSLDRYFSLLVPAAAFLAGTALASLPRSARPPALAAIGLVALTGFMHPVPGSRNHDVFATVARQVAPRLSADATPLLTAAPDAYGFWLPKHAVRRMRPGARGAVLLDAAQRSYAPRLSAEGTVLARVSDEIAFTRTNGEIDADPAVLVAGEVISRADATKTNHGR